MNSSEPRSLRCMVSARTFTSYKLRVSHRIVEREQRAHPARGRVMQEFFLAGRHRRDDEQRLDPRARNARIFSASSQRSSAAAFARGSPCARPVLERRCRRGEVHVRPPRRPCRCRACHGTGCIRPTDGPARRVHRQKRGRRRKERPRSPAIPTRFPDASNDARKAATGARASPAGRVYECRARAQMFMLARRVSASRASTPRAARGRRVLPTGDGGRPVR